MSTISEIDDLYRDTIGTVDASGKRIWVYPKKPKGRYHNYRIITTIVLLGVFFVTPFIYVDGHPFMMFNIFKRTFVIFGQIFFPQDFVMFAIGMIMMVVFIIVFTVAFGRVWCGWACPQTIFMEMVFRKIEYWIEGDRNKQMKLKKQAWNTEKIWKRTLKYSIYVVISFVISHTTMAYMIGLKETIKIATSSPANNPVGFIGLLAFTGAFFFVFTYLREQVCIAVCPYGRLQGVFVNNNTLGVMYDFVRGEPRGRIKKRKKKTPEHIEDPMLEEIKKGDCIDCNLCVQVCPTGIDIRNGTQLECVGCTACIDACDQVMEKVGREPELIKHASQKMIETGDKPKLNARLLAYIAILVVLIGAESLLLIRRSKVEATVLRARGSLFYTNKQDTLSNLYNTKLVNKTFTPMTMTVRSKGNFGKVEVIGNAGNKFEIDKGGKKDIVFFVHIPRSKINKMKTKIELEFVDQDGKVVETSTTSFMGP